MRTESRSMLLKSRVQETDSDPGQDSRPLCPLQGRIGEVDHDTRHDVISPLNNRSLPEPSHPLHLVADRQ